MEKKESWTREREKIWEKKRELLLQVVVRFLAKTVGESSLNYIMFFNFKPFRQKYRNLFGLVFRPIASYLDLIGEDRYVPML